MQRSNLKRTYAKIIQNRDKIIGFGQDPSDFAVKQQAAKHN